MDRTDRQIVHCLQREGRAPFRRIADVLGVSEQTVARRYRGLLDSGTLRVVVRPDARALGAEQWFVRIGCRPDAADALAHSLASHEDVSWISITAGGGELVCATRLDPSTPGGSALPQRLPRNQVLGFTAYSMLHMHIGGEAEWMAFDDPLSDDQLSILLADADESGPQQPIAIRAEDAPLLAALAKDGRAGVVSLARATGWPQSRVSLRLRELLSSGAASVELDLAPGLLGFHATAYIWLTVEPGELDAVGHALSLHPETNFVAAVTGLTNLMAVVTCRDTASLYSYVTTKVGCLRAVRQAEVVPVLRRVKQAGTRDRNGRLELAVR